jgi:hypothetical protein
MVMDETSSKGQTSPPLLYRIITTWDAMAADAPSESEHLLVFFHPSIHPYTPHFCHNTVIRAPLPPQTQNTLLPPRVFLVIVALLGV